MTDPLTIIVHGYPAPQGSKRTGRTKKGVGYTVEANKIPVDRWRSDVKDAALKAMRSRFPYEDRNPLDGPVYVRIAFTFTRPAGHYGTGRNADKLKDTAPAAPVTKGDLDKLARSTFDALTAAGVWRDDKYVVASYLTKVWAGDITEPDALDINGAVIRIEQHQSCPF